jgi:hypothetical protein
MAGERAHLDGRARNLWRAGHGEGSGEKRLLQLRSVGRMGILMTMDFVWSGTVRSQCTKIATINMATILASLQRQPEVTIENAGFWMGACGSKDTPSQAHAGAALGLSRWQADADGSPSGAADDATMNKASDGAMSDLTLNSVVAYHPARQAIAVAPRFCVTGWEDGSIKLQNWRTNAVVSTFMPHSRAVNRIVVGPKTNATYSCSRDTTIAMLPPPPENALIEEPPVATVLAGHSLNVSTITVDADESALCSGGRDTQTILWDLVTSKIKAKNTTPQNVITCSKWVPGERVIAQGSEDLSIKLWDERNGLRTPAETLRGYIYFPLCLDVTLDGLYILTSSKGFNGVGCEVRVWDRRMGKQLHELAGHQQDATACCFLPASQDRKTAASLIGIPPLVTASKDGTVKIWDAFTCQILCEAHEPNARMFTSISHAGDGVILASTLHGLVHAFQFDPHSKSLTVVN